MAEHIELKYSELDSVNSKLAMISSNYLENAYKQLKQSTDLGSSIMQAGWNFKGKQNIFEVVKKAEDKIKKVEEDNQKIANVVSQIKSTYEGEAVSAKSDNNSVWIKNALSILGVTTVAFSVPSITAMATSLWAGKKIISSVTNTVRKHKVNISSAAKKLLTAGVTLFALNTLIQPINPLMPKLFKPAEKSADKVFNKVNTAAQNAVQSALSEAENNKIRNLQNELLKYSNTPYVSKGHSVNGVDCSGLVMQAYKDAGIKTDFVHSAAGIYKQCEPVGNYTKGNVDLNALKEGDLVFYSDGGTDAISHVGIYMGDGNVMSALNPSQGVVTKSINYTYKNNIYVARVAQ